MKSLQSDIFMYIQDSIPKNKKDEIYPNLHMHSFHLGFVEKGITIKVKNRVLLKVYTDLKNICRLQMYNYENRNLDLKPLIKTKYQTKEEWIDGRRIITIETPKDYEIVFKTVKEMKKALVQKMLELYD